ncbi:MAG: ATP-binding protein [Ardenticatenales bacterium]|nr:ATP-binding protein [Ardenticatenales bacterium]
MKATTDQRLLAENAAVLEAELAWFGRVLDARFKDYFAQNAPASDPLALAPPSLADSAAPYARFISEQTLSIPERIAVVLALAPYLRPQLLDIFFTKNAAFDRPFSEFGLLEQQGPGGVAPSGETLAFILAGADLVGRLQAQQLLAADQPLISRGILQFERPDGETPLRGLLRLAPEIASLLTLGRPQLPAFGADFPARHIETELDWDSLVLHPGTRAQVDEIETWLQHGPTLLHEWGMAARLRPGYRSLFYGPPGTGKTMTACLLGKATDRPVFKVDLSLVVSKYIGETEKNLARVFDQAQYKGWILFFDEADALFGKRSETRDAHDRYANQEVSFLLQRIETFDGVAILASNQKENLDQAFTRRFESIIYFPLPRPEERLQIWQRGFSSRARLADDLDLTGIAREHELTGGAIMNVVRYASLKALADGREVIWREDLLRGIQREYVKEGKLG